MIINFYYTYYYAVRFKETIILLTRGASVGPLVGASLFSIGAPVGSADAIRYASPRKTVILRMMIVLEFIFFC